MVESIIYLLVCVLTAFGGIHRRTGIFGTLNTRDYRHARDDAANSAAHRAITPPRVASAFLEEQFYFE